ncbi:hypothetical protein GCM10010975_00530 [Comamonas phosphati]|nr:hypothetical protein GCM10010975_00530 [Comamonas phosphati]
MPQAVAVRTARSMPCCGLHPVSAQAHVRAADVKQLQAACRSQNRMHVQKALMEYLLLGRQPG